MSRSSDNDQYRSRNALIRRHIEKMDASLHVGTKEFDISKVSEVDSVDDLLIDNAARYLLKDWKGVGELVNGVEVALEYTAERGIALLKQNRLPTGRRQVHRMIFSLSVTGRVVLCSLFFNLNSD